MTGGACSSLYFVAPRTVAVVDEPIGGPSAGELLVRSVVSAISPGSELLLYRDEIPAEMALDASIPGLARQRSTYPVRYGYASVGTVVEVGAGVGADWAGRLVFALHPHCTHFLAREQELEPVPADVSADDAALFANMETAVTLLMDGRPIVGERVAVCGQGVVGLLTTALLARFALQALVTFDLHPLRRRLSAELGASETVDPATPLGERDFDFDLAYELSGSPAALDQAIAMTGFHGRVVIGSWYGTRPAQLALGGAFHRSRMRLSSSQVSTIDPALAARWSSARRRQVTWDLLAQLRPARLVTHRFPFASAPAAYELLDEHPDEAIQVLLEYGA